MDMRKQVFEEVDIRCIIGGEFCGHGLEIDGFWLFEVDTTLDARVEHHTIQIRMLLGDSEKCISLCYTME